MKIFSHIFLANVVVEGFLRGTSHHKHIDLHKMFQRSVFLNAGKHNTQPLPNNMNKKYPLSKNYNQYLRKLNSKNETEREETMFGKQRQQITLSKSNKTASGIEIIISGVGIGSLDDDFPEDEHFIPQFERFDRKHNRNNNNNNDDDEEEDDRFNFHKKKENKNKKSENFEVISTNDMNFTDVGGYEEVKQELLQIVDLLKNHTKYDKYNVRVPKGLVFEGNPGNGKTYMAKALAGEANTNFISVSGSEFQEKYVGVGPSRVRELFALAKKNKPCIIFIDEIDALGRKRTSDGEMSSSERDSTLNELLVSLDGFKKTNGVFVIVATNRLDMLDSALLRPGRIDKKIHIGNPDTNTRKKIIDIHINGKPCDNTVVINNIVEETNGYSCAEIENLLNEAMLNALRNNRDKMSHGDIDNVMNKMMAGWQPTEHDFGENVINHILVHEMGHAIVGMLSLKHANVSKVTINLHSPNSPGYTLFETASNNIYTREQLTEHLTILLAGRIAEEIIYGKSVTTGAINDFEEAHYLAEKMIVKYGMGKNMIYPSQSEKYKKMMDEEIHKLIQTAHDKAEDVLTKHKNYVIYGAELLKEKKTLYYEDLQNLLNTEWIGNSKNYIIKLSQ